jgi:RNA polymerase sigma-70 factor, ECF subfamily
MQPGPTRVQQIVASSDIGENCSSSQESLECFENLEVLADEQLIELLKTEPSGPALELLFARYRHLVFSISSRILRDQSEAEDVVQDVFLEISKKAKLFDPSRGTVRIWILQFAYSRSLNARRYLALRHVEGAVHNGNGHKLRVEPSYLHDGLERLTWERRLDLITEALQSLSGKQKEVLEFVYFQGLLIKEVAEQMNESVGNVRHYYYRGLKKLRQMLADMQGHNGA